MITIPPKQELENFYWDEFLTLEEIGKKYNVVHMTVRKWMDYYNIPRRAKNNLYARVIYKDKYWAIRSDNNKRRYIAEHRYIIKHEMGINIKKTDIIHHKDGNSLNNHPLNLQVFSSSKKHQEYHRNEIDRPPWFFNYMVYAHIISLNSTCKRLKVGCVITNFFLDQMYSFGLNGNAKKLENSCDGEEPGKCGCIHAENNALLKVGVRDPKKILFLTHSPCLQCAKLIINSGASYVYYAKEYRDSTIPIKLLHYSGIRTCPYPIMFENHEGSGCKMDFLKTFPKFKGCGQRINDL